MDPLKPRYYRRDGTPYADCLEWARDFENAEKRRVDETFVTVSLDDTVRISTVHLGLDHGFGDGPPLIFETMVFGGAADRYQERYSTEESARGGHARIVGAIRAGKDPEAT